MIGGNLLDQKDIAKFLGCTPVKQTHPNHRFLTNNVECVSLASYKSLQTMEARHFPPPAIYNMPASSRITATPAASPRWCRCASARNPLVPRPRGKPHSRLSPPLAVSQFITTAKSLAGTGEFPKEAGRLFCNIVRRSP